MKYLRVCHILFFSLFVVTSVFAQSDLNRLDFSKIRVADLSDAQIREVLDRARQEGISINELERVALTRGMRPSEVVKLRGRLREVQSRRDDGDPADRRAHDRRTGRRDRDLMEDDDDDPLEILTQSRRRFRDSRADTTDFFLSDTLGRKRDSFFWEKPPKRVFGASLFNNDALTFEPSLNIPTPENYQLGPGDELVVDLWGAAEMTYNVAVSRDGMVRIQNLGPVNVNGLTMRQAEQKILSRLSRLYAGLNAVEPSDQNVFADVTLGRVRSIKVHILGEVNFPGSYTLPALSTAFNALYVSGGPSESGTYRRIQVVRGGIIAAELDVYDFLVSGRQEGNVHLRDQDIIKVDPYISRIEIEGEVKRPGLFEVRDGETLGDLIRFAGSFNGRAYTRTLKVYRNSPTERQILTVPVPEFERFRLADGDRIIVDPILERFENRVEIQGSVFREGDYELSDAATVYALIQRAEGLKGDAFLSRGQIYRIRDDLTPELISFDLGKVMSDPQHHDLPLRREDVVIIPSIFELQGERHLEVEGSVQKPGSLPFMDGMTLEDAIVMSGGLKEEASLLRIEVARRRSDGTVSDSPGRIADIYYFDVDRGLELSEDGGRFLLQPFDQIFVRRSPGYIEQRNVRVTGEVLYPGTFTISNKTNRISDIVERAGGLTPEAYPAGARLIRTREDVGAVGINLDRILADPGSDLDLLVEAGDSIHVPLRLETVKVSGAIHYPVSIRYSRRLRLMDYVNRAGGATDQADLGKAYVVYANGSVDRLSNRFFYTRYPHIEPGAEIVVPTKPEREKMSVQERTLVLSSVVSVAAIVSTAIFQLLQSSR